MKKLILSLVIIGAAYCGQSQIQFGAQLGTNFTSSKAEEGGFSIDYKAKAGLNIGVLAEIPIANSISFRPEFNYMKTNSKGTFSDILLGSAEDKLSLSYINIPLNVVYNMKLNSGTAYFGIGPSVSYGLSGTSKSISFDGVPETSDVKFDGKDVDDDYLHLKAINFGLGFLAGYKLSNNIFANIGYTIGLSNISAYSGSSFKSSSFELKLGYFFSNK